MGLLGWWWGRRCLFICHGRNIHRGDFCFPCRRRSCRLLRGRLARGEWRNGSDQFFATLQQSPHMFSVDFGMVQSLLPFVGIQSHLPIDVHRERMVLNTIQRKPVLAIASRAVETARSSQSFKRPIPHRCCTRRNRASDLRPSVRLDIRAEPVAAVRETYSGTQSNPPLAPTGSGENGLGGNGAPFADWIAEIEKIIGSYQNKKHACLATQ